MESIVKKLNKNPFAGLFSIAIVWSGMALGHSGVVLQHHYSPMGLADTLGSIAVGLLGFALVWIGMKQTETHATILGYLGGNLIWCGWFEWTWRYTAHFLKVEGITDTMMIPTEGGGSEAMEIMILSPELLMIQATTLIVIAMLIFLGADKETKCRMFLWFHRNFRLKPNQATPNYKRQHARTTAIETVFLIWTIYLFAIFINDPRGIKYDSMTAVVITLGFVAWGLYLCNKLFRFKRLAPTFRYAIPTGSILWLPIEAFSRWGLYPEIWIYPEKYTVSMLIVLAFFIFGVITMYRADGYRLNAEKPD